MQSDSMRWRNLSQWKKIDSSRLGHISFFFFVILYPLRHCGAIYQAEILGAASGAEMADIEQIKKIVPFVTCEIPFQSKCLRVGVWCQRI